MEEIEYKKELEKQLEVLSKLSEERNLSVSERLSIYAEIRTLMLLIITF